MLGTPGMANCSRAHSFSVSTAAASCASVKLSLPCSSRLSERMFTPVHSAVRILSTSCEPRRFISE